MAIAEDRRRLTQRLTVLRVVLGVAFGLLACGFWFFQVVQHAQFKEMAENNHQRTLTLRAPRGIIYDRTGKLLVENRNSFNISIVREHTKDLDRTIRVLSQVTGLEEKAVREVVDKHRREPSYRPIVVIPDATLAQVASVTARAARFRAARRDRPGSADAPISRIRTWPRTLIGYVGEASEDQMQSRRRDDRIDRRPVRRRARLQQVADGRGRRQARRRQQRGPRNPHARRDCRRCRGAASS